MAEKEQNKPVALSGQLSADHAMPSDERLADKADVEMLGMSCIFTPNQSSSRSEEVSRKFQFINF